EIKADVIVGHQSVANDFLPDIALPDSARESSRGVIRFGLFCFALIVSFATYGLGVNAGDNVIFTSIMVCLVMFLTTLCVAVGIGIERFITSRRASPRDEPHHQIEDRGEVGANGRPSGASSSEAITR